MPEVEIRTTPAPPITVVIPNTPYVVDVVAGYMAGDAAVTGYVHEQTTSSLVWTIQHNRGYKPAGIRSFRVDGSGNLTDEIEGIPSWPTDNILIITYDSPEGPGRAFVS